MEAEEVNSLKRSDLEEIASYAVGIGPDYESLNANRIQEFRRFSLLIHPYTVNEEADMRKLLEWGVTGVFTNYTDLFNQFKKNYKH
jgi:glycerophosphoryl diester phosphodiesterase